MDEADTKRLTMGSGSDGLLEAAQKIADCAWEQRAQFPPESADAGAAMALAVACAVSVRAMGLDEEIYQDIMRGGWKRASSLGIVRQARPDPAGGK